MMISALTPDIQPATQAPESRPVSKPAEPAAPKPAATVAVPKWPERGSASLAAEVLGLQQTALAFTSGNVFYETGADFWDLLATAIEGDKRAAKPDP